jgi:hypothetical protein
LSWKTVDQVRLADHYLSKLPFASETPYAAFASFMSIKRLVGILQRHMPAEPDRSGFWSTARRRCCAARPRRRWTATPC